MIPLLSPTPDRSRHAGVPTNFRPLSGRPRRVRLFFSDYSRALGRTSAQKQGLRYEETIQRALLERYVGSEYAASPHIHFEDDSGARTCLPDGILALGGITYILEIKRAHCAIAWWQLERLYRPLIANYYHDRQIRVCEIVRTYDPAVTFPVDVKRIESIDDLPLLGESDFGVLLWKP